MLPFDQPDRRPMRPPLLGLGLALLVVLSSVAVALGAAPTKNSPTPTMSKATDAYSDSTAHPCDDFLCVNYALVAYSSTAPWPTNLATAAHAAIGDVNDSRVARTPLYVKTSSSVATLKIYYGGTTVAGICGTTSALACRNGLNIYVAKSHAATWVKYCQIEDVTSCYDIGNILTHEIGHRQGLAHYPSIDGHAGQDGIGEACDAGYFGPGAATTIMQCAQRKKGVADYTQHFYGTCDNATLQMLWGLYTSANKIPMCPGLTRRTTALTLSFVKGASQATFTANLKLALPGTYSFWTGLAYQDVAILYENSALSSRAVQLQVLSGGSWVVLGNMTAAGSGTYTYTRNLPSVSSTYRAVLPSPATDNLLTDTSSSVVVPGAPCTIPPCPI